MKGHVAGSEYSQVAMQGHYPFIFLHGQCGANSYGFLADPTEPFGNPSLSKQYEHFLLNHAWPQKAPVHVSERLVGELIPFKLHVAICTIQTELTKTSFYYS